MTRPEANPCFGRTPRARAGRVLCWTLGCILAVVGALKLLDLEAFRESLRLWTLVPAWARGLIAAFVPIAEIAPLMIMLTMPHLRKFALMMCTVILVFIILFVGVHFLLADVPPCNCLGVLSKFIQLKRSWPWMLGLSTTLLVISTIASLLLTTDASQHSRFEPDRARSGYSLIEILLVIAIIAIILALTIPSLSSMRFSARQTSSLSSLRQLAVTTSSYNSDYNDNFPVPWDPRATSWILRNDRTQMIIPGDFHYFSTYENWHYLLASYYGNDTSNQVYYPTEQVAFENSGGGAPFAYSCAFLAHPAYWNESTRTGSTQWRGTRSSSVAYASRKVLMISRAYLYGPVSTTDIRPNILKMKLPHSAVDGHATMRFSREFKVGISAGDGVLGVGGSHWGEFDPAMHTIDGIRGFDFDPSTP
jgi:prepilin-type N-terminal cleavage/methylation domain-containing protein